MFHCGMRQMEEKHVANQVDLMVWSNRLDLLALSNFKGEVQVHRLHWQKVWNLPPPKDNVVVDSMAWRPDGKALAIGYNSGTVCIIDIEDKEIIDKYDFAYETSEEFYMANNYGIPCITWAVKSGNLESALEYNVYDDPSIFLPNPPSPSNTYKNQGVEDNVKSCHDNIDQTQLSMLMIAYGSGNIYMSVFGRYPYGTIHLSHITKDDYGEYKILDINLSEDFSVMQVLYLDKTTNNISLSLVNTSVLSAYAEELFTVATKHGQIVSLLTHLDRTMISITEAWEHILLEMDTKMAYYASSVAEGGVSADLLELLMLGVPSDELEVFLLQELTAKGLKKFGNSVELSYSTIQKLVLRQLNIIGQSVTYHLAELRGLTRIPDRYKVLCLEEKMVTEAIRASCAFLNKCLELQQVIDVSMRNYKAFFRWLFVVIVRLLDEQTSSEIVKITQQELTHIAEFLYNFDNVHEENTESPTERPVKFNLERLGQYLLDEDLTILPDDEDNPWHKFLKENSCLLKENDTIFSMLEFKKFSLVQQQNHLKISVGKIFDVRIKDVAKYFSVLYNLKLYEYQNKLTKEHLRISQIFDANEDRFMMAFTDSEHMTEGIKFMSVNIKDRICIATASKFSISSFLLRDNIDIPEQDLSILDLQFYSSEYLSVLVNHPSIEDCTIFIQVPLKIVLENSSEFNMKSKSLVFNEKVISRNLSPQLDISVYKVLDKMDGFRIAVSGGRKVAVVLSNSHRKVRVFEMEINGEDEEDETLDTTPLSQGTNASESQNTPDKHNDQDITF
ncbi:anaphase-promoting complex subunit 4 [Vanessa atalanta]|uniref:anaphase-promoting complex subunit 4 n=1 Tax=Vanessa atalanta TaxID=42275 RepID=UPI001FCD9FCD|nr:anaphase-promoting complex subunit 4 [Vanessa atalanta]